MHLSILVPLIALLFALDVSAVNIFEQMFGGGGGGHPHQHQQQAQQGDVPSDSNWYQSQWAAAHCSKYLCPRTLACVHFPHHCPCAFPALEDKVELGEGSSVCASKGGFKIGETQRKIELARKGLI